MKIELTNREFRLLLDLVYTGNWVMNSARGDDRITEYDQVESAVFSHCAECGMGMLAEGADNIPSGRYVDGGIHEAILDYEDTVFYGILAEELARRDLKDRDVDGADNDLLVRRIESYMQEFQQNGVDNISVHGV